MEEEYRELTDREIKDLEELYNPWAKKHKRLFSYMDIKYPGDKSLYEPFSIYSGDAGEKINTYLREVGQSKDEMNDCYWAGVITTLRLGIVCAPRTQRNLLVYRWVLKDDIYKMLSMPSKTFMEHGFLSTSLKPDAKPDHIKPERELLIIKVDSETPAVFVNTIANRGEYELLFLDGYYLQYESMKYVESVGRNAYLVRLISTPYMRAL